MSARCERRRVIEVGSPPKELSLPEWFLRSIRTVCLSGAVLCLLYLLVSQLFPLTLANRLSLLYNQPLFSAFFFWLYCRLRENTKFPLSKIALDALVVGLAASRLFGSIIPSSGHALFLSYSFLTVSNRGYRILSGVLLTGTIALKLYWGDYRSWVYGIAAGLFCGFIYGRLRKTESSCMSKTFE